MGEDFEKTVIEESQVAYKCKNGYFNASTLQYPEELQATCDKNILFQGVLPFWTIDGQMMSLKDQSSCLTTTECMIPPPLIEGLVHTWNGADSLGSSIRYTCHMDGERALTKFETKNSETTPLEALGLDTRYFLFRSKVKDVIIDMRITSSDRVYIYLSFNPRQLNNTFLVQIDKDKVSINRVLIIGGTNLGIDMINEIDIKQFVNDIKNMRLVIGSNKIYIGYWDWENQIDYHKFLVGNLNEHFYIGFSSYTEALWEVSNGKNGNHKYAF